MAKTRSPWLIGCGIGCGVLLLLVLIAAGAIAFFVRDVSKPFDSAIDLREDLEQQHGEVAEFRPWPGGAVPADRLEAFLRVRESCAESRRGLEQIFRMFDLSEEKALELEEKSFLEQMSFAFGMSKQAIGLAPELGKFYAERNQALVDAEMGLGEYTYIYVLAYYSWLGHSPGDGPGDVHVTVDAGGAAAGAERRPRVPARWAQRRVRRDFVQMLRNQLDSVAAEADASWWETLAGEIEAMESDSRRVPWQDGLPRPIADAFEPFRARLEPTYSASLNAFELSRNRKKGLSIQAE